MNQATSRVPILVSLVGVALVGFVLFLLQWAAPVVTPIMLAMYLAALAAPLYIWMSKRGWATGWSLAALVGVIALVFVGLGLLLWLAANRLSDGLSLYGGQIAAQVPQLKHSEAVSTPKRSNCSANSRSTVAIIDSPLE